LQNSRQAGADAEDHLELASTGLSNRTSLCMTYLRLDMQPGKSVRQTEHGFRSHPSYDTARIPSE